MLRYIKQLNILFFVMVSSLTLLTVACKKVQEIEYVYSAEEKIVVRTGHTEELSKKSVTLFGQIDSIADQKIISYGFIIKTIDQYAIERKEQEIEVGKNTVGPTIKYTYQPNEPFDLDLKYTYSLYVRTEKGYYRGEFNSFQIGGFLIDPVKMIKAKPGEEIVVQGDFKLIDQNYKFFSYFADAVSNASQSLEIPYTIAPDKKSIRFQVPKTNGLYHGQDISFSFKRREYPYGDFYYNIAQVKILGQLLPLVKTNFKPIEVMDILGLNLPDFRHPSSDFKIILGDLQIPFTSQLQFNQIENLKGNRFKFGYTNGVETVIFKEEILFYVPDLAKISIEQSFVHPGAKCIIQWPEFWDFQSGMYFDYTFGNLPVEPRQTGNESLIFEVGDLKEGSYSFQIKDRFYDISLPQKIVVKNFDWVSSDKTNAYEGDRITLYGNFSKGNIYSLQGSNNIYWDAVCDKDGEAYFTWFLSNFGSNKISIGYQNSAGVYSFSDKKLAINPMGITLESFAPSSGLPGSLIHVKGKSIKYAQKIRFGDYEIVPIPVSADEIMFTAPMMSSKGKFRISADAANKIYQSDSYFELL
ncbi:hypothetical protein [Sphingobacterium sp. WOUb80]|uniref:hypothetical protein n=1 Tax=Sphingobacterium sp. WOUb80 TaxID=3234028 RepID=UPI003CF0420E